MRADSTPVPRFLFMQTSPSAAAMPVNDAAAGPRQRSVRFAENFVDVRRQGYRTVYEVRDDRAAARRGFPTLAVGSRCRRSAWVSANRFTMRSAMTLHL